MTNQKKKSYLFSENFKIIIVEKSDFLAKYMRKADFVITSNGRTVFEIASLKVPIIAISVNVRETHHKFVKKSNIGFQHNSHLHLEKYKLIDSITAMLDFQTRQRFVNNLQIGRAHV